MRTSKPEWPWKLRYRLDGNGNHITVNYLTKPTALREGERLHAKGIPATLHRRIGGKSTFVRHWEGKQ